MRIFAIRDEYDSKNTDLAYLLYFEKSKTFYIFSGVHYGRRKRFN